MEELHKTIGQNFDDIKKINVYRKSSISFIKTIILAASLISASFWSGFELNAMSYVDKFSQNPDTVLFIVFILLFLIFADLCIILIPKRNILALLSVFVSLSFIVGFIGNILNIGVIISGAIIFIGFLLAMTLAKNYSDQTLKIRFFTITNIVLKKIILSIAIIIALIFFNIFSYAPLTKNNPILSESVFESITTRVSTALYPITKIDFSKSLRVIVQDGIKKVEDSNGITLSKEQNKILLNKSISQYQGKITKMLGSKIDSNKKLSTSLYNLILYKFNNLDMFTRQIYLAGMAFILFLSVIAIGSLIKIVLSIFIFFIYEILKVTGFFTVIYEKKSKENITL